MSSRWSRSACARSIRIGFVATVSKMSSRNTVSPEASGEADGAVSAARCRGRGDFELTIERGVRAGGLVFQAAEQAVEGPAVGVRGGIAEVDAVDGLEKRHVQLVDVAEDERYKAEAVIRGKLEALCS